MQHINKDKFRTANRQLNPGPVAVVLNEDGTNLDQTIRHLSSLKFPNLLVLGTSPPSPDSAVHWIECSAKAQLSGIANAMIDALEGRWVHLTHNAEYLHYPFCETRSAPDLIQFVEEERRESIFCTTIDLYPSVISKHSTSYDHEDAWFDASGYFARDRYHDGARLERQIDVFGGLKWRYAEHIPWPRQRIDRIGLFKAKTGLRMDEFGHFNDPEYNTMSCPWHSNLTAAIASYRVAKSLHQNPGSIYEIETFVWEQSKQFEWTSKQFLDCGIIEPGQWF